MYIQKQSYLQKSGKRYMKIAHFSLNYFRENRIKGEDLNFEDKNFQFFLEESHFERIKRAEMQRIKKEREVMLKRPRIQVWRVKRHIYLLIKHRKFRLLLKDKKELSFPKEILVSYLLGLLFLIGLYFWLSRSLRPLKELNEKIQRVSQGDLSVSFKSTKRDEVAEVSNAFEDALRQIERVMHSRQLFLRTIMHELKTPIAKGKLMNSLLTQHSEREGYEAIFERLALLIEEFSKIEQMLSSVYQLKMTDYNIHEVIDHALEFMIMGEEERDRQVDIREFERWIIHTDFELLSLAIKNLIDNALKYSPQHSVTIEIYRDMVKIRNSGEPLGRTLQTYTQPFHQDAQGLGLGLYIVQNIIELLALKLKYEYTNGENIFTIWV